ncbi:MAG: molybdopterin molybdotransferase MoeA [Loktanella sp.]|nr:molybdopterin molybdotransferase MoeA [Loktanella sp.]
MISVAEAQALCLDRLPQLGTEAIALRHAAGRTLAAPVVADRDQPPFAASAMDGYAVQGDDLKPGATYRVAGEAAAGHLWNGRLQTGEALRIFTGAPVPDGLTHVVIQEDVDRDGEIITVTDGLDAKTNIRPSGADFPAGFTLDAPRVLTAADLALLAAMNAGQVTVARKPTVALMATGDELVMPGETPRPDQIIASNVFALAAMVDAAGGAARILPIARDTDAALTEGFRLAAEADLTVTIGGASVGDHDLVRPMAEAAGFDIAFHKIALRPGKPLMLGHRKGAAFVGLPGNPVSAIVCGHLFLLPMVRALLGQEDPLPQTLTAKLTQDIGGNGPRTHYMRAHLDGDRVTPFDRQDSALLTVLQQANALVVRPPDDGSRVAGDHVEVMPL